MARPGPALAVVCLGHAAPTPLRTAQSAAYRVFGATTTKLKPGVRVWREEMRRRQSPRKLRAAPPAAASCGGISANFENLSRPSHHLP